MSKALERKSSIVCTRKKEKSVADRGVVHFIDFIGQN